MDEIWPDWRVRVFLMRSGAKERVEIVFGEGVGGGFGRRSVIWNEDWEKVGQFERLRGNGSLVTGLANCSEVFGVYGPKHNQS